MRPRFRGKIQEDASGYYWICLISVDIQSPEGEQYSTNTRFKSRDEAVDDLKDFIKKCITIFSEEFPELNINPETYYDLKNDATRPWDKSDEN